MKHLVVWAQLWTRPFFFIVQAPHTERGTKYAVRWSSDKPLNLQEVVARLSGVKKALRSTHNAPKSRRWIRDVVQGNLFFNFFIGFVFYQTLATSFCFGHLGSFKMYTMYVRVRIYRFLEANPIMTVLSPPISPTWSPVSTPPEHFAGLWDYGDMQSFSSDKISKNFIINLSSENAEICAYFISSNHNCQLSSLQE